MSSADQSQLKVSPVTVIASEPCTNSVVAVIMSAKRVDKVTSVRGASNYADRNIK